MRVFGCFNVIIFITGLLLAGFGLWLFWEEGQPPPTFETPLSRGGQDSLYTMFSSPAPNLPTPAGHSALLPAETSPTPAETVPPVTVESPPAPVALSETPTRLVIDEIALDTDIVPAEVDQVWIDGQNYPVWSAPGGHLAGWHTTSVRLGEAGNLVLNGHHNIYGQVFASLIELENGDIVQVYGEKHIFSFQVVEKVILLEEDQPLDVRMENASWIQPTPDARLTLVTCWPYESNSHRLIIVAKPL